MAKTQRTTSWRVRAADRLATWIITSGGMMVIVALTSICVFLLWVVIPLFSSAKVIDHLTYDLPAQRQDDPPLFVDVDEYLGMGLALWPDGDLASFHARTGQHISTQQLLPDGKRITAHTRLLGAGLCALGLQDGTIVLGKVGFKTEFAEVGAAVVADLNLGETSAAQVHNDSVAELTPTQQIRLTTPDIRLNEPISIEQADSALVLLDYRARTAGGEIIGEVLAGFTRDNDLFLGKIRRKKNLLTGKETTRLKTYRLPFESRSTPPKFLLLNDYGNHLVMAWADGVLRRYDLRTPEAARVAEELDVVPGDAELTEMVWLIGSESLITGDSRGRVAVWFAVRTEQGSQTADGRQLVQAHRLGAHDAAITALSASPRDRGLLSTDQRGEIFLQHATSEQTLARVRPSDSGAAMLFCTMSPKADAAVALDADGRVHVVHLNNPHPETTFNTVFGQVWYEGIAEPEHTWQSSSGADDFEPKLGLVPLIFGTLKATVYSMLFAVPVALLAAIYTSQFLHPRLRNLVKPIIEMMASLPSVVLGFVAALVLAPVVQKNLIGSVSLMLVIPVVVWCMGYLWQTTPTHIAVRLTGGLRMLVAIAVLFVAVALSYQFSGAVEELFFSGDVMGWLDGRVGRATPLWWLVLFPAVFFAVILLKRTWLQPTLDRLGGGGEHNFSEALVDLAGMAGVLLSTGVITTLLSIGLNAAGFDLRGELVGTYVQRNTLVVGFVMGFAVIPIIYTIAEDALSSVPGHLKAGSLACGASQWQTAVRVVMPIAMSGIYSAVLIGLGRAVGETMIVVMAAGNTPILDLNPFNGLRALSANIAVELPEAVKDGTLYRVLFLAGLVLFVMTFMINTVAEIIRLRLRRRAYQL